MATFILGILFGWLAEWVFYNFWVKPNESREDCSSLREELDAKNRQIIALQDQLSSSSATNTAASKKASKLSSTSPKSNLSTTKATKVTTTASKSKANTKTVSTKTRTKAKSSSMSKGDDFTKLTGIGPSMAATLKTLGIDSYKKLADTDDDILRDMLEASGARMNNNKEVMDSWNEQATLAANGDFDGLTKMQALLKK